MFLHELYASVLNMCAESQINLQDSTWDSIFVIEFISILY